ncbi:hypothetical protein AUK11_02675 [bacterium CG2_30_37_16]|nr:MAG: hypothetical protein AUK11_02675 [bacterium CG2_30_37_16]PIP30954.1 MAG: hypothetical protein COX25_01965 [bacterium (Candidatus Howlettbacteria) CG23_combo_of_CG06-09_8_20_14_all_37_9]PIX98731.1 MAG: hypothetical protein COZ22_04300 [bacterium (Candidatus Howlettbacteria) CG_4_10_14_3_um_filter_37_10]
MRLDVDPQSEVNLGMEISFKPEDNENERSFSAKNANGEILDVFVEGDSLEKAEEIVILVHGFGTDRHERGLFDQISKECAEDDRAILSFSLSGFGESEGDQKTKTLDTMADDFKSVVEFVEAHKNERSIINIIGFSMGACGSKGFI